MGAQRLAIEVKQQEGPVDFGSVDDFQYRAGEAIDPRVVLAEPTISLYCLDHPNQQAIFVETPADVDLSQAPFYHIGQYQAAQHLIAVSYETLHQLASTVSIDPHRITLVYSTGRCGSTLVGHALNVADGVFSFSEPAVYTQLVALRAAGGSNEAQVSALVRDCTHVLCAGAQTSGASAWALKFRSFDIELGDLFYHHFPEAKVVFLYRHAEGYVRSAARAFRLFEPEMQAALPHLQGFFSPLMPLVRAYTATHATTISPVELLICAWVSVMERCLDLQRNGVPMICARYEDLQIVPHTVLDAIFAHCGFSMRNPAQLERVLAQDSQYGTHLSQARAQESLSILTPEHVADLHRLLRHYAPTLPADVILPHTFRPGHP